MNDLKKLGAWAATVLMLLCTMLPGLAAAEEALLVDVNEAPEEIRIDFGVDNDMLLEGYFYGAHGMSGQNNADKLTSMERAVYNVVKAAIDDVAAGRRESTNITISAEELGCKMEWSDEDFGAPVYNLDTKEWLDTGTIRRVIEEYYADIYHPNQVLYALLRDNPYGFYWMDNHESYSIVAPWQLAFSKGYNGEGYVKLKGDLSFSFPVDVLYAGAGAYTVDTAKTASVQSAMQNAHNILANAPGNSDLDTMIYYMKAIRNLSDYNTPASVGQYENTAPWQMIYVFDGDPDTKVVCEGYSKAFQYLCDNTAFIDPEVWVYSVTGNMNGGPHMWNIAHLSTGNYLVDVTNCLMSGTFQTSLFFSVPESGSPAEGYDMVRDSASIVSKTIHYDYDTQTKDLYSTSELTLSTIPLEGGEDPEAPEEPADITIKLEVGQTVELWDSETAVSPLLPQDVLTQYGYSGDDMFTMDFNKLSLNGAGSVRFTLVGMESQLVIDFIVVDKMDSIDLPMELKKLEAEAFMGADFSRVVLPAGIEEVDPTAFDNVDNLTQLVIPAGVSENVLNNLPKQVLWLCESEETVEIGLQLGATCLTVV